MNTKINGTKTADKRAHEDLHAAIASVALVRSTSGAVIVASEQTGARNPWIFDFRALMLRPEWLDRYAEIFWEKNADKLPFQVGGMETAGIPLVAAIVMKSVQRGTPVNGFFIRKSRKRQGLMKTIEGSLTDENVILVDDLINSGQTIDKQVDVLAELGKKVSDVFVILAFRAPEAYSSLERKGVSLTNLFTLEDFRLPLSSSKAPEVPKEAFETLWRYQAPSPSLHLVVQKSAPVLDDDALYMGFDDGTFRALDKRTGDVLWEYSVGRHPVGKGILSSPALHEGIVYFGAYDGRMYALDAKTGKTIWTYDDADWIGSSPDIAADLGIVFVGLEFGLWKKRGGIAAFDLKTGAMRWVAYHKELTHGSPLYIEKESMVVIGSNDGVLYAYDAKSGIARWKFQTEGDIKTRPVYDTERRAIIFGSMDGRLYVLSALDGTPLFAREVGPIYSIPLVYQDTVYMASLDKCIYAIDCTTWKDRWVYETGGRIFASPVIAEGSLWIGSNDGRLYELDPASGTVKNFFQATERIINKIAYDSAEKRFFVPTQTNEIYCLRRQSGSEHP